MSKKRKLHIHSDCTHWGGGENMVRVFLMNPRINKEFDVSFTYRYSFEYFSGMDRWLEWDRVRSRIQPLRMPMSLVYRLGRKWRPLLALKYPAMLYEVAVLADIFRQERPDVLHVNNGGYPGATSCNSAVIAAKIAGVQKITYMINSTARNLWWEWPLTLLVKGGRTQFISASKGLMRTSQFLWHKSKGDMAQGLDIDTDNWHVLPNTVLYQTPAPAGKVRQQLEIDPKSFLFVVAGADEPRKGRDVFIKALFRVAKEYDVQGWVSDPVNNKGVGDYDLINAADCVVVPSLYDEDFPNVILIAMMYGKPVIASAVGGISEVVEDQVTGFTIKPGDVEDLSLCMARMVEEGGMKGRMGEAGREKFHKQYSEDRVIRKYISLWKGDENVDQHV